MALATFIGLILGCIAALKQNTWIDHFLITISSIGISAPSFVAGTLIVFVFAILLQQFTGLHLTGSLYEIDPFEGKQLVLKNLILPTITLGIRPLAIITQLTRSSMLDVLHQDYIRTARAKGLSQRKVIVNHALKNALNPVITAISGWFASLLTGAFFVEYIFAWQGLGAITINAVFTKDFPVIMGVTVVIACVFVGINLFVDLLYTQLDPRVKL
jgi:peptide/nickel transport system permease protein